MTQSTTSTDPRPDDVSRPETADVLPAHRFDDAKLAAYLAQHIEGFRGPLTVRQFRG